MDESETYVNMRLTRTDAQARSRAEPDVSYVELNVTALSAPRDRGDGGGLSSSYAAVNFPNDEPVIDEDEAPPIAAGPSKLPTNAQAAAHEQQPKVKIGNVPFRQICLLCLVIGVFLVIVAGLSIHETQRAIDRMAKSETYMKKQFVKSDSLSPSGAAQERKSKVKIGNRRYRLICLLCLVTSALIGIVVGLSIHGIHNNFRHQFTEMETKYRSVNETKAQICELLTSRREQTCSKNCVTNTDRRYYVSKFTTSFYRARKECSNRNFSLVEVNSRDEVSFVFDSLVRWNVTYWVGKCANGDDATGLLYNVSSGRCSCSACTSSGGSDYCLHDKHHFICVKSAPCWPEIPANIQLLCQQPEEPT
ncbi:uncharacterized protein [Hemitrygon akajei]|uniref:uncharacterized protein n=1 Tax=Hemitrygon akajei TaxID=2704970 RepID=UPI003BF9EC94